MVVLSTAHVLRAGPRGALTSAASCAGEATVQAMEGCVEERVSIEWLMDCLPQPLVLAMTARKAPQWLFQQPRSKRLHLTEHAANSAVTYAARGRQKLRCFKVTRELEGICYYNIIQPSATKQKDRYTQQNAIRPPGC